MTDMEQQEPSLIPGGVLADTSLENSIALLQHSTQSHHKTQPFYLQYKTKIRENGCARKHLYRNASISIFMIAN